MAWYIAITFVLVLIIILESAYRSIIKREAQLKALLDEYSYSLQLVSIDQEDRRGKNKKNDQIISRQIRFLLRLKNTLQYPVKYTVRSLEINGIGQQNPLSR